MFVKNCKCLSTVDETQSTKILHFLAGDSTAEGTEYEGVKLYKNIWSEKHFAPGFQCIPTQTDLSIITSIAFRRGGKFRL